MRISDGSSDVCSSDLDTIAGQVARLHKSKQGRFGPDAMARVEKDGGFLARQLTDTQYLSRLAGKYLRSLYPTKDAGSVYVIPGRMTAMLTRLRGLNSLLTDHNIEIERASGRERGVSMVTSRLSPLL